MRRKQSRTLSVALAATLSLAAAISSAPVARAADNGRLAFVSDRAGAVSDVWTMDGDGADPQQVTTSPENELYAFWSPDGTQIAYSVDMSGGTGTDANLWLANADGSGAHELDGTVAWDDYPVWSPDGSKIAFVSNRAAGDFDVWVMDVDGSNPVNLTANPAYEDFPTWSPDGTRIAFMSTRDDEDGDIYVMDADGTDVQRLTTDPQSDAMPAWSPDGGSIAFVSGRDGSGDIYLMASDGSGQTPLTTDPASDLAPAWSPDGTQIAFATTRDGNSEIYVMTSAGASETNITNNAGYDSSPDWGAATPGADIVSARVSASVSVLPSAACLILSETFVDFGTLPLGATNAAASPSVDVTNCSGGSESVLARGTDASGTGSAWALTDAPVSCADTLGLDAYRLALDINTATNVQLSTNNKTLYSIPSEASMSNTALIDMACPGSSGGGATMTMQIVFLAIE